MPIRRVAIINFILLSPPFLTYSKLFTSINSVQAKMEYKVNLITLYSVATGTPIEGETVILAKVCPFSIEVESNILINRQGLKLDTSKGDCHFWQTGYIVGFFPIKDREQLTASQCSLLPY
jgi:hypothetical protein